MTGPLTLAELLELLGYDGDESAQLASKASDGPFVATVHRWDSIETLELKQDRDVWFGVNPVTPVEQGRPDAGDVTRLAGLWADLDVKDRGCPSFEVAQQIVDDLSGFLGIRPVAVTWSGHGLQPLWAVEGGSIADDPTGASPFQTPDARAILRRWGRLVAYTAEKRGAAVDSVYDLPRILRAPGSVNWKGEPVRVVCLSDTGAPVGVDRILETLDEYNIPDLKDDHTSPGEIVSAPSEWSLVDKSQCQYAAKMASGWKVDDPNDRHPWLVAQATRIAVLHRNGCLDAHLRDELADQLVARFRELLGRGGVEREPGPGEIADAFGWGQQRAAAMSDEQVKQELGNHLHADQAGERQLPRIQTASRMLHAVPDVEDGEPAPVAGATALKPRQLSGPEVHPLTDRGNAGLFVSRHADHLRYAPSRAGWLKWSGHHWVDCEDNSEALEAAVETVASIRPLDEPQRKHKTSSLSRRALESMTALAKASPEMRATAGELDADPYALNTPGGIVDLRTGILRPSDPGEMHTRSTSVAFDQAAECPRFLQFLSDTFDGDQEMVGYLQRLAGYSAAGIVTHHVLPFLHGGGGNGKSVFLDVVMGTLGSYASTAPPNFLLASAREDESAIARLKGIRLVVASEVSQSAKFDEAKVKLLTGGDRITARHLFAKHFTFYPTHTLWLMGNHQPRVEAGGESFWRRLRLIPFTRTVPKEQRIEGLAQQLLLEESAGILAWIVVGAIVALSGGLFEPESVLSATQRYADEEDALARFAEDMLQVGGGELVKINTRDVRAAYEQWCREESEHPISPQTFGRELRSRWGISVTRSHGQRFYSNLCLDDQAAEVRSEPSTDDRYDGLWVTEGDRR